MFGRIRVSASSLESLEGSPSKILKDDSFSIYEATLMKLKLGAQRDGSASSKQLDEINDSNASSPCVEEPNKSNCIPSSPASASSSQQIITSSSDGIMVMDMDTDCSSITTSTSFSDHVSAGHSEPPRHNNISILHFFKFKDPGHSSVCVSSCGEPTSTKNDSSGSISSSTIACHSRSEMVESIPSLQDCELSE